MIVRILAALIGVVILLFVCRVAFAIFFGEQVFPLAPGIDTEFSAGYSDEKYDRIKPSMSEKEVIALLGQPFSIDSLNEDWRKKYNSYYMMSYSKDGACCFGDFAWMIRNISLDSNRRVVRAAKSVAYD